MCPIQRHFQTGFSQLTAINPFHRMVPTPAVEAVMLIAGSTRSHAGSSVS